MIDRVVARSIMMLDDHDRRDHDEGS